MYTLVVMNNNAVPDCVAPDVNVCEVIIIKATELLHSMILVHR